MLCLKREPWVRRILAGAVKTVYLSHTLDPNWTQETPQQKRSFSQRKVLCPPTPAMTSSGAHATHSQGPDSVVNNCLGWRGSGGAGSRLWKRGAARAQPRGMGERPPYVHPPAVPAASSPPSDTTGTQPDGERRRNACDCDLAPPVRARQGC